VTAGSGPVVGTIAYMAPEQTEGARADVRTDIFSFGVTLYEMLTGVRPFDGNNVVSTIRRINDATPRPPHEMRPDIPPALASVIAKALEKDPTHRFQSVSELRAQLRAGAMRSPVPGEQPLSSIDTPAAPRRPVVVQTAWRNAAIAVVAIAVIAAAGIWSGNRSSSAKPNEANAPGASASAIASEELTQRARRGQALLQRYDRPKNIDQAIELFREVIAQDASNALAHAGMAEAYLRKDGITPDPQMMKQAADSASRAVALNGDLAIAHLAVAMVALREGRRDDALRALERARDLEPRNVDGLRYFGEYYRTTDPARAEELLRAAVAAAPDDWRAHFSLGLFYYRSANYTSALSAWEQARKLSPDNMVVLANLGGVYHSVDRTDAAATVFQRAL
jgi:serine/threonine-protein kinase